MTRRTVAPTLTKHIMDGGVLTPLDGLDVARRELRALRAVATAAKAVVSHDECIPAKDMMALERALSRLSTPKRARKR